MAEAKRVAKGHHAIEPSPKHVRQAAVRLGLSDPRGWLVALADSALAVGTILIGIGVGYEVNLATGGTADDGTGRQVMIATMVGIAMSVLAASYKVLRQR